MKILDLNIFFMLMASILVVVVRSDDINNGIFGLKKGKFVVVVMASVSDGVEVVFYGGEMG